MKKEKENKTEVGLIKVEVLEMAIVSSELHVTYTRKCFILINFEEW
jgi:hypothetical protein